MKIIIISQWSFTTRINREGECLNFSNNKNVLAAQNFHGFLIDSSNYLLQLEYYIC